MKKVSLLLGTLSGAMAGYLFSNKKLREELANAPDAQKAAKILGKHLAHDGDKLAKDVKDFVESDSIQKSIKQAKLYANKQYLSAKKEVNKFVKKGEKQVRGAIKKAKTKAS